jgi:hypothetical protein
MIRNTYKQQSLDTGKKAQNARSEALSAVLATGIAQKQPVDCGLIKAKSAYNPVRIVSFDGFSLKIDFGQGLEPLFADTPLRGFFGAKTKSVWRNPWGIYRIAG